MGASFIFLGLVLPASLPQNSVFSRAGIAYRRALTDWTIRFPESSSEAEP
jgi:hypothetical protein